MNCLNFQSYFKTITINQLAACSEYVAKFIQKSRRMLPDASINPMKSGVMIICYIENNELMVVFIRRTEDRGVHSGQFAFPGGRFDEKVGDKDTLDTAIRETCEETDLRLEKFQVLTALSSLYVPPSNFIIDPYVAFVDSIPSLTPCPDEVADAFAVPINFLLNTNCVSCCEFETKYGIVTAPCYTIDRQTKIWGATAIILSEFLCLEKERRNKKF